MGQQRHSRDTSTALKLPKPFPAPWSRRMPRSAASGPWTARYRRTVLRTKPDRSKLNCSLPRGVGMNLGHLPIRGVVFLSFMASLLIGPLAIQADASPTWCKSSSLVPTIPEISPVPNRVCVTYLNSRGFRGYIEFNPVITYQFAGRFFVTLTRNGTRVAKSGDYVNQVVHPGWTNSWPTPYAQTSGGKYCARVYERRTKTLSDLLITYCHSLP